MKRILLLLNFLFGVISYGYSQGCFNVGTPSCATSIPVCIESVCGQTQNVPPAGGVFPGCPANSIDNPVWLSFIACSDAVSFNVAPNSCAMGGGIQTGIYSGCDVNSPPISPPVCACTLAPVTISGNVTVGETYYILVDGCAGDLCNFQIDLLSGVTCELPLGPLDEILGDIEVCPGARRTYAVAPVANAGVYQWTVSGGTIVTGQGTNTIDVLWQDMPGTGVITLTASDFCNNVVGPVTLRVTIKDPDPLDLGDFFYCENEPGVSLPQFGVGVYPQGTHRYVVQGPPGECDTVYNFRVTRLRNTRFTLRETICKGDFLFVENPIGTSAGCAFDTPQSGTPCILPGAAWNGCDSIVSVFLTVVDPQAVITGPVPPLLTCRDTVVTLDASKSLNTGTSVAYEWVATNGGNIVGSTTSKTAKVNRPGTYILKLIVNAANGAFCEDTAMIVVKQAINFPNVTLASQGVSCNGRSDGSITANVTGGTPAFTYRWNTTPVQTTQTATGLRAGNYTVTVTGNDGCTSTANLRLDDPAAIVLSSTGTDVSCFGGRDGVARVTATGGTPGFSYAWNTLPVQTTATATGLGAGTATVTVTDANGCTNTSSTTINSPTQLTATATGVAISCNGGNNGSATVTPAGGTPGYTYRWNSSPAQTSQTATNLIAGTYIVTVTDNKGCTTTATTQLSAPNALAASATGTNVSCFQGTNGTATVTPTGGTPGYSYNWSSTPAQTTATATNLPAGTFNVTVTDANSCTTVQTVNLTQPTALTAQVTNTPTDCSNTSDGTATVAPSGGVGPYSYNWDNGQTVTTATNLNAGAHAVTVTDANGCTHVANTTIGSPSAVVATASGVNILCFGNATGTATVSANGGAGSYTYRWSTTPAQLGATAINLVAGAYTVTVTDANGCTDSRSVTLTQPSDVTLSGVATDATCGQSNGSITLTAGGGVGPYTYAWTTPGVNGSSPANLSPGTYNPTVTDANGCTETTTVIVSTPTKLEITGFTPNEPSCFGGANGSINVTVSGSATPFTYAWSHGPTALNVTGLSTGAYTLSVTDATGCTISTTIVLDQPDSISISGTAVPATCSNNDGEISIIASGGTGAYTYSWSVPGANGANPTGLAQGVYVVTVTDANQCTNTYTTRVNIPDAPQAVLTKTDALCYGSTDGSINVAVTGGTAPYRYSWSAPGASGSNPKTLGAGTYTVTITDSKNCLSVEQMVIAQPDSLSITLDNVLVATCGQPNGSVSVTTSGGTAPYNFRWSNNTTVEDASGLVPGSYCITVTDRNGCSLTRCYSVSKPDDLNVSLNIVDVTCFGGNNGQVDAIARGGNTTPGYTYLWNDGSTGTSIAAANAGNYSVTVTDGDGCTYVASGSVTEPTELQVNTTSTLADCQVANGTISMDVTGGVRPYSYAWNQGTIGNIEDPQNLLAGVYFVTITDGNQCTLTTNVEVQNPNSPTASIVKEDVKCAGDATGKLTVTAQGGTPPFTYQWAHNGTLNQSVASSLLAGTYVVTVVDAKQCITSTSATVIEPPVLEDLSPLEVNPLCNGDRNGTLEIPIQGGVSPYAYNWSNGATTARLTNLGNGQYQVTVTDANNCSLVATGLLDDPDPIVIDVNSVIDVKCFGDQTGAIQIAAVGGNGGFNYNWSNQAQNSPAVTNLAAGVYQVTVVDSKNCRNQRSITIQQPSKLEALQSDLSNYGGVNVTCANSTDGWAKAIAQGGTPPYQFAWSNGQTSARIDQLSPGTYTVTITDGNGCITVKPNTLTSPEPIDGDMLFRGPKCYQEKNGYIYVNDVTGGVQPYVYSLNDKPFTSFPYFKSLEGGSYKLIVQDANGCEIERSFALPFPKPIILDFPDDYLNIAFGDSIDLVPNFTNINPTTPGVKIEWFLGDYFLTNTANPLATVRPPLTTVYGLRIVDTAGCVAEDRVQVRVGKNRDIFIPNAFTPGSGNGNNEIFTLFANPKTVTNIKVGRVYNRWGELVHERFNFKPNDVSAGWDGKLKGEVMQPAVFVYYFEVEFFDGHVEKFDGDVTLVR